MGDIPIFYFVQGKQIIVKKFDIPEIYNSPLIAKIKAWRRQNDKLKRDFSPTMLDFGPLKIYLARHFGFCYGVENAVEIAYKAIEENPDKKVYLLSEMIHNPEVNADLQNKGLTFIMDTKGHMMVNWDDIQPSDVVIVPAFGTTLEIQSILEKKGIDPYSYDTTCPFVEKVWKRAAQIAEQDYTIIIHGKPSHEETRATYSHSKANGASLVIKDMAEAQLLASYILGQKELNTFYLDFEGRYSEGFDAEKDLIRLGVVNQTTMLAAETQAIAEFLKNTLIEKYKLSKDTIGAHFADTRDTLCYATNDNQTATATLLQQQADLAIVVGGYNSSNTSHLVELCEQKLPNYFIKDEKNLKSDASILSFDIHKKEELVIDSFLPKRPYVNILLTCGASCPDSVLERVLLALVAYFPTAQNPEQIVEAACR